ncbi:Protein zds1 [Cytospora mali]|uniref:Protein zds1 n=1 Tax=Cytospora mali TaxID=578113 RepID=A0A194UPQ5_CYTMA|nr:Protein zds1 [Valsa mali var. pyri (nom. inval.)]
MMTSSRLRDPGASFAQRRGHLSISDPSHHVTEAIGTLYGSDDDSDTERENRMSRPLSFLSYEDEALPSRPKDSADTQDPRGTLQRSTSENSPLTSHDGHQAAGANKSSMVPGGLSIQRNPSHESGPPSPSGSIPPMSPTPSLRDMQAAESSMSMTNIDNPSDIAQELSNLQALRRMSMDVGNSSDPDLMPFQGIVPIPSIAPTGDDDEADPSRLLWVPANVHPELAPEQFKSFLERRVNSVKRRSGDSMLSADGLQGGNSGGLGGLGSLRRTKSKLSRQIDNTSGHGADGYVDGSEMLRRQDSLNGYSTPELSLEELVNDPTKAVQKLAQEASDGAAGPGDMPILPVAPGMGLRRSTRTQYRKSGSLRGERTPLSKRAGRQSESQDESLPPMPTADAPPGHGLSRVQSDPPRTENFSRPQRSIKRQQGFTREADSTIEPPDEYDDDSQEQAHSRNTSDSTDVPQIVETPPAVEQPESSKQYPERSSSQKIQAQLSQEQPPPVPQHHSHTRSEDRPPARTKQIPLNRQATTPVSLDNVPGPTQTMNDITNHPSAIPGSSGTRTDNLTFIPTFSEPEKKKTKDSDTESTKSSKGWKWFKSEDKKKEKEREEQARRSKSKSTDKSHENARLDVLQNSIENVVSKGRESLLLDRDTIDNKLQEERKKESNRKSGDSKKEKDGFFGSFFGSKKKADKDAPNKKQQQRALSPDPPPRVLKPDVDYAYTRFPILEERAIYRMAHIKLANPKRNLLSQVLLSNFMYSYLAKIQAMHPQIQVPMSPQQKRQEEEKRRKEEEAQQQAFMEQQMSQQQAQNSIDQYNFEYHRSGNQYGDSEGEYIDENQEPYDYEQGRGHGGYGGHDQNGGYGYGHDEYGQQQYYDGHDPQQDDDENSMW